MDSTTLTQTTLTQRLKAEAVRRGFSLTGVCPAVSPAGIGHFQQWLANGYAGEMHYLADRAAAYADPARVLDGARSVLVLAFNYRTVEPAAASSWPGARVALCLGARLSRSAARAAARLARFFASRGAGARVRGVVDTAPVLEREFAELAGLGWIGKNTLLLNKQAGSWFFLAALLTDLELDYDHAHESDHCGTCRACLDACPTGAFVDAYVLDARKCISYLTIESPGAIPRELRAGVGDWLFGCDVCQEVCPWNHRAPVSETPDLQPAAGLTALDLAELFWLDEAEFRARFRHTPLWRPKRRGLLRNAAIVLGNQTPPGAIEALVHGLEDDDPLVRGACAWALGRYDDERARHALVARLANEADAQVREEIVAAVAASLSSR